MRPYAWLLGLIAAWGFVPPAEAGTDARRQEEDPRPPVAISRPPCPPAEEVVDYGNARPMPLPSIPPPLTAPSPGEPPPRQDLPGDPESVPGAPGDGAQPGAVPLPAEAAPCEDPHR